jgi:hypothetical protein
LAANWYFPIPVGLGMRGVILVSTCSLSATQPYSNKWVLPTRVASDMEVKALGLT